MSEHKYYCRNCGSEIKPTDTVCPKCGKKLSEVGRNIVVTLTETIAISDEVKAQLTKEQIGIIEKVRKVVKKQLASKQIESITINFRQRVSAEIKIRKEKYQKWFSKKAWFNCLRVTVALFVLVWLFELAHAIVFTDLASLWLKSAYLIGMALFFSVIIWLLALISPEVIETVFNMLGYKEKENEDNEDKT
jgi:RNA polymerase subunit RPABC4/transcription elongation factor Spt4